jgi:hypothetical protein
MPRTLKINHIVIETGCRRALAEHLVDYAPDAELARLVCVARRFLALEGAA